jgi:hypothetical protein
MRKLKLDIEALSIQSFELEPRMQRGGTVVGRDTDHQGCPSAQPSVHYEWETCADTCECTFSNDPAIDTCGFQCATNYVCTRLTACFC